MRLDDQRRSTNVRYRTGGGGGGGPMRGLPLRLPRLSLPVIVIIGIAALIFHFAAPAALKQQVYSSLGFGGGGEPATEVAAGTCPEGVDCGFFEGVLGSTEDVWRDIFAASQLPRYQGARGGAYQEPVLIVFTGASVNTACGTAGTDVGPFYCPGDSQLYINPSFYEVMARQLNADGDFAQAYVIAHEVGHHVQNLIGATRFTQGLSGVEANRASVRLELQADCFAGVWANRARRTIAVDSEDLREALNAAHQIGDDTLQQGSRGYSDPDSFTHGTSVQRQRWFRRGYETGDATQCDTFAVRDFNQL